MGAGEQRVFKILELIHTIKPYSMILVDEIDLLLHVSALKKMIEYISKIAKERNLQIIFTTHSIVMNELADFVDISYLQQTSDKTLYMTPSHSFRSPKILLLKNTYMICLPLLILMTKLSTAQKV